jgi:hypothetical protein
MQSNFKGTTNTLLIDLDAYIPKSLFLVHFGISMATYTNWKNKFFLFDVYICPMLGVEFVVLKSIQQLPSRYICKFDFTNKKLLKNEKTTR